MNSKSPFFLPIVLFIATMIAGTIIYFYQEKTKVVKRDLEIIQPWKLNKLLVDSSMHLKDHSHVIDTFQLVDQTGAIFDSRSLTGKVQVVDFFFATCPSICPVMNNSMYSLVQMYEDSSNVEFLSITVMPETDTAEALFEYAKKYSADPEKWHFLTGDKKLIYDLARKNYFTMRPAEVGDESHDIGSDFIHTDNLVLVDKHRRLRGYYSGLDSSQVEQLKIDIEILRKEH